MSMQSGVVKVQLPKFLSAYERPLFLHAMQVILGGEVRSSVSEGGGEIISVDIPVGTALPQDVVGAANAALRSIGRQGRAKEVT